MEGAEATRIMIGVNESTIKGYPHASISSRGAFDWALQKIVRSNTSGFKFLFLHVQVPDEDGFDDMDSLYASPQDFKNMKYRDRTRGLHLLEYFVNRCHEIGVACEAWIKIGQISWLLEVAVLALFRGFLWERILLMTEFVSNMINGSPCPY
ncbi:ADENINE NUCLEOTIDE ALPHA HYDROLASES-LIKE SUPERFAMILY PROTEIN [Salix koriyanagi]|uniref:ADENINE NUCLEOTIDE ALPHA HYDROLASES-LIKE SUPERFAMILY PROTEIN n=1 Tax=Salix koriyanagi TaxID=2511006 RepID=A0A9Q0SVW1_9ROSI|nr:ADENINE NUCLEOTIDE ALPHA HYDROLASES-LIKE SUPERFAMILY PROTEIN [Salix koriyanagi]